MMKRNLRVPSDLSILEFEIRKPSRSFFGKLSEVSSSTLNLEVVKIPDSENYVVFGYSFSKDLDKYIDSVKSMTSVPRNHIRKFRYWRDGKLVYMMALKSKCDFIQLAEENKVSILSPYVFDKGIRKYLVLGNTANLSRYRESVSEFYGESNVYSRPISFTEHLSMLLSKRVAFSVISDKLTTNEIEVLKHAFISGYFDYPKQITLDALASSLGLSKVTVDIHIRKAVRKILEEMLKVA